MQKLIDQKVEVISSKGNKLFTGIVVDKYKVSNGKEVFHLVPGMKVKVLRGGN